MVAVRSAHVNWEGDLRNGKGTVSFHSGALPDVPVTWKARVEESGGMTSPEELLAGAHAACYSMAISSALAKNGTPPQKLKVNADCTFAAVGEGFNVTEMALTVTAKVAGLAEARFKEIAKNTAEHGCPISEALALNVYISINASLE
jgi:osmotically inducible protein OsmC